MAIDLGTERLISIRQAAKMLPSTRRSPATNKLAPKTVSAVFRWITEGFKTPDGRRVRLEAVRIGRHWVTSVEALQRFTDARTPQFDDASGRTSAATAAAAVRTPTRHKRAMESKNHEAEMMGV